MSTIQSYRVNDKTVDVDLTIVPELSDASRAVLTELSGGIIPAPFQTAKPLKDRIQSMDKIIELLKETQDPANHYKLKAVLTTALVVVLTVGIFFGLTGNTLSSDPFGPLISALLAYIGMNLYISYEAEQAIENIEKRSPKYRISPPSDGNYLTSLPKAFFGGFVFPLFEALTRESRIKRVFAEQRTFINETLKGWKEQNDQVLPSAHLFYKNNSAALISKLEHKISEAERQLEELDKTTVPIGRSKVSTFIATRQTTLKELQKLGQFYQQWDA